MSPLLLFSSLVILAAGSIPAVTSSGPVSRACLDCIREQENGPANACNNDGNSESCGEYQIKNGYFTDAQEFDSSLGGYSWKACSFTRWCSEKVIQAYMSKYATQSRLGETPTCKHFSRMHNGGLYGNTYPSTLDYWSDVQNCLRN